jgi:hypothetical protein
MAGGAAVVVKINARTDRRGDEFQHQVSAVLDDVGRVVGLLFAGSSSTTVINPIKDVLQALSVTIHTS